MSGGQVKVNFKSFLSLILVDVKVVNIYVGHPVWVEVCLDKRFSSVLLLMMGVV